MNTRRVGPLLLSLLLVACGGREPASRGAGGPVGRWTLDVRATVLRDAHPARATDVAERQREESAYLGSEAGKAMIDAVASGLRADLDLRADGSFTLDLGAVPMDPREPRTLTTVPLGGTRTQEGTKLSLAVETRGGVRVPPSDRRMAFTVSPDRLDYVETGEMSPFSRIVLARR
jgi:hypothetical protein